MTHRAPGLTPTVELGRLSRYHHSDNNNVGMETRMGWDEDGVDPGDDDAGDEDGGGEDGNDSEGDDDNELSHPDSRYYSAELPLCNR